MRPGRRIFVALVACSVWLGAMSFLPGLRVSAEDQIPSRLTDKAFWQLINDLSEPGGYFRSDNFLSNENAFQTVIPELKTTLRSGGVYLGVGPEQNFTYIVGDASQARVHRRHPPRQPASSSCSTRRSWKCRQPAPNSCPACSPGSAPSISRSTHRSRRCSPRSPARRRAPTCSRKIFRRPGTGSSATTSSRCQPMISRRSSMSTRRSTGAGRI